MEGGGGSGDERTVFLRDLSSREFTYLLIQEKACCSCLIVVGALIECARFTGPLLFVPDFIILTFIVSGGDWLANGANVFGWLTVQTFVRLCARFQHCMTTWQWAEEKGDVGNLEGGLRCFPPRPYSI